MIYAYVYLFLLIISTVIFIIKKYNFNILFLMLYYILIASVSCIAGEAGIVDVEKTSLLGYLFLFGAYLLFFYPFMKNSKKFSSEKLQYGKVVKMKPFCYVYIICTLITVYCYVNPILQLINDGDWGMVRYTHYLEGNNVLYTNIIEQIGIAFTLYFYLLAILLGMLMLKNKEDNKLAYMLILSAILSNVLQALYVAGRGTIFNDIMLIIAMYIFIVIGIEKAEAKKITLVIVLALVIIIPYMIDITLSRFSTESVEELLRYFGEAPVVFNANVATIDALGWGRFAFSTVTDTGFSQQQIGGTWGVRFYTFVGYLFIDWGPVGVIAIGIIIGIVVMNKVVNKQSYKISDLYLIFFYYQTLLKGALVIGSSFMISLFYSIIIYIFIKVIIENTKIKKVRFVMRK